MRARRIARQRSEMQVLLMMQSRFHCLLYLSQLINPIATAHRFPGGNFLQDPSSDNSRCILASRFLRIPSRRGEPPVFSNFRIFVSRARIANLSAIFNRFTAIRLPPRVLLPLPIGTISDELFCYPTEGPARNCCNPRRMISGIPLSLLDPPITT